MKVFVLDHEPTLGRGECCLEPSCWAHWWSLGLAPLTVAQQATVHSDLLYTKCLLYDTVHSKLPTPATLTKDGANSQNRYVVGPHILKTAIHLMILPMFFVRNDVPQVHFLFKFTAYSTIVCLQ